MKKLLLFGFVFLLLMASVSAIEWDNIKDYNESSRTITISNSFLKIWPLGEVAEITLITPQVNKVIRGPNRLVAEFKVKSVEDYERVFKNMQFYDVNSENIQVQRSFTYKYAEYYDVIVPDWDLKCSGELTNGSKGSDCIRIQVSTHIDTHRRWIDFDSQGTFLKGEKDIGVFTDVGVNERIEWIPTLFGVRIPEWAEWTDALNDEIILYYSFENSTINGTTVLDLVNTYDDVDGVFNDPNINGNFSGIIGSSVGIFGETGSGRDDWIEVNSAAPRRPVNWTFNGWFNSNVSAAQGMASRMADSGTGAPREWRIWYGDGISNPGDMYEFCANGCVQILTGNERQIDQWVMITVVHNDTGMYFYENGTEQDSVISALTVGVVQNLHLSWDCSGFGGGCQEFSGRIDEVGYWNRSLSATEVTQLFNDGAGITFDANPNPFNVTVDLSSPLNGTVSSDTSVVFNTTLVPTKGNLTNATLLVWFNENDTIFNETVNIITGNVINSTTFNVSGFPDGTFRWNVLGCIINDTNTGVICSFNETNATFNIDNNPPNINVLAPVGTIDYAQLGGNLTLNWTITDPSLDACFFEYNGTNTTLTCADNNFTFGLEPEIKTLKLFANDTLGNNFFNQTSWNYSVFRNSQTFNSPVGELSGQQIIINVTFEDGLTSNTAFLHYNGTEFTSTTSDTGVNVSFSASITTPPVDSAKDINFTWEFRLTGGTGSSNINSTQSSQRVVPLNIDDCSTSTLLILNYTLRDEDDQTFIVPNTTLRNMTIEIDLTLASVSDPTLFRNFSTNYTDKNPAQVCIDKDALNDTTYRLDTLVRYETTDRVSEFHNIQNFTLTNASIPQNINLFDLATVRAQEFLITYKDRFFLPVDGALIDITRNYIPEGTFKSVEVPKTDVDGKTLGHLVLSDVIYTMIVSKNGEILAVFDNIIAFCDDQAIGDCRINLNEPSTGIKSSDFTTVANLTYTLTFDKTTRTITTIFSTVDGSTTTVQLNATKFDNFGNLTVCSDSLTTSSGTLTCIVPSSFGNLTVIANLFNGGQLVAVRSASIIQSSAEVWGGSRVIMALILFITLPLMALTSGPATIILAIMGLIMAAILNLYDGGNLIGVGSTILWFIIAGIVILVKINNRGKN